VGDAGRPLLEDVARRDPDEALRALASHAVRPGRA
jgi:hypothetical protein